MILESFFRGFSALYCRFKTFYHLFYESIWKSNAVFSAIGCSDEQRAYLQMQRLTRHNAIFPTLGFSVLSG